MTRFTKTVMVVEDDPDCLESVCDALESDGYGVLRARNGRAALDTLERQPAPALILLDLMLPELNGWQFLDELRAVAALAHVPVVLLSGERNLAQHAAAASVAGALMKPVGLEQLLDQVRRVAGPPHSP